MRTCGEDEGAVVSTGMRGSGRREIERDAHHARTRRHHLGSERSDPLLSYIRHLEARDRKPRRPTDRTYAIKVRVGGRVGPGATVHGGDSERRKGRKQQPGLEAELPAGLIKQMRPSWLRSPQMIPEHGRRSGRAEEG